MASAIQNNDNIEMSVLEDSGRPHIDLSTVEEVEASYADVISGAVIAPPPKEVDDIERSLMSQLTPQPRR